MPKISQERSNKPKSSRPKNALHLSRTLRGHSKPIGRIAWSPDGELLASPSEDGTIIVWNVKDEQPLTILEGRLGEVFSVTWSGDGTRLASQSSAGLNVWEILTRKKLLTRRTFRDQAQVAWSPTEEILACFGSNSLRLLDTKTYREIWDLQLPFETRDFAPMKWSPDGSVLAIGAGGHVSLMARGVFKFDHHIKLEKSIYDLAWSLAGARTLIAVGGSGPEINIFEPFNPRPIKVLEGHTDTIEALSFSHDGRYLASRSYVSPIRVWDCKTWDTVATIDQEPSHHWPAGIAFHPRTLRLATLWEGDTATQIWKIIPSALAAKTRSKALPKAVHHTTAKIVLVGDSGVGKTGLGWRLAHGKFKEHSSTHGQQFWVVKQLHTRRSDGTDCEAIVWDLAGQPDYRLTHALFLDDADLALVLFDPTDSRDPLHGVEFWLKQLRTKQLSGDALSARPTILVGARTDRGEARLTQDDLTAYCEQRGISGGYIATSAKAGSGLSDLLNCMKSSIPWDAKTSIVTTLTFKRIKDYVLKLKENRRRRKVIVSPQELRKRLQVTHKRWGFTDAEMMTAVTNLANYGYVQILRTSQGEERVLLVPELLNNLAASFVLEARRNPKGLGSLEEKRLLAGDYAFRELAKVSDEERDILLDSAALLFLEHNICFRETDPLSGKSYLVFPELINLKKPSLDDDAATEDGVAYTISGAVENVYASLVVLLGYTQTFTRTDQWRSQARYEVGKGLICGFRQEADRDGELDLVLYFGVDVGRPVRALFQGLFESFLARRNLGVIRYEPVHCPNEHALNRAVIREELRNKSEFVFCPKCGGKAALPKAHEPIQLTQTERRQVDQQQLIAAERSRFEQAIFQLVSYVEAQKIRHPSCFVSYAWGDKKEERWVEFTLARDLQKAGVNVIFDRWENERIGASVSRFISKIEKSDRVIMVGTESYRKKYENKETATGYVVAAEVDLISNRLIGTEAEKETVLPILLTGDKKVSLPPLLHGRVYADFRKERNYFPTAFDLILDLYEIQHNTTAVADLRQSLRGLNKTIPTVAF